MGKTTTQMQMVAIDKLVPYVNNARTHSPEQINKLRSSLREFGFVNPVIIDGNNGIIAGHGRVMAAKEEGISEVPCVLADYLTEAQKKAYILADNRFAQDAGWDEELLRLEIEALQGENFDVMLTGFEEQEIADLFAPDGSDVKDDGFDVEAELEKPCMSKTGDIWKIGKHKVICGDSTIKESYDKLLSDHKVNLVCTDPPYFVALDSASGKIKNDDLNDKDGYEFLMKAFECLHESMAKDASIYVFYATAKSRVFYDAYEDAGFKVGAGLIWKKPRAPLSRTDWKFNMEPIIWGWRKDGKHIWYGDQKQKAVFEFDGIKNSKEDGHGHPSSKPVPLIAYLIQQCTQTNGTVLDCFLGSASTLIACEQIGRICYGIELEPKFVDVAVKRYIELKGNPAWEYAGLYYDDGISGTKMETRPGLLKMLDDCEHGCIDYVIVKSISRLARNTTDCLEIVRRLLSLNIPVFFEKEDIDTGKMESELLLSIMGSIAESESVSISENNKWGVAYRFQNGTFKNSCVPYGYEWNAKESVMEIIPEQAEIVKYIFSRTLAGMGTAAIAKELSKRGVPTKRGGNWTGHTVKEIIRNEKYIGDCLFQKTYTDSQFNRHINNGERDQFYMEKHHEAIISKADYEAANALIDLRRDEKGILTGTTKYQNRYPLSGKVICGLCGSKMKRKTTENGVIFACFTHIEDKEVCKMKSVKQEDVEFAFATMMNKLIYASTKIIKPYLEDLKEINMTDELLRISDIDSRLEEIVEQKQTLRSLFAQQLLDPAVYKQENNILTAETERLNCQKDALSHRAKSEMTYIDETERLLRFTRHAPSFDGFDADAFEKYVEKIIVINRSTLEFHLKCGLNLQERTE